MTVTIYTTQTCGYCRMAKDYFGRLGVPYSEKKVDEDYSQAMEMVRLTGQQGVPVIVIGNEAIVGFDRPKIDAALRTDASSATGEGSAHADRPSFGAAVADAATYLAKREMPPAIGAYVGRVASGSSAERLGVRAGDIITRVNGRPIASADDLTVALSRLASGGRIVLEYTRSGQHLRAEGAF